MGDWAWRELGNRPVFFPVLFLLVGVGAGPVFGGNAWHWALAAALLLAWSLWRGEAVGGHLGLLAGVLALGAAVACGALRAPVTGPRRLEGRIEEASPAPGGTRLVVESPEGRSLVFVAGPPELLAGQTLVAQTRLKPLVPASNPGEWSRAQALGRRGVVGTGTVEGARVLVTSPAGPWERWLDETHRRLAAATYAVVGDDDAAALLLTLSAGLRSELDAAVEEDFALSGLAHVLSVSGLHVAVLAFALFALARWLWVRVPWRRLRRVDPRQLAAPLALPLVWAYVAFTGNQAPAVRSAVMCGAVLVAHLVLRRSDALNAVALAAGAMVLLDPGALFDLSLQLSFLAVLGLIWLAPTLRQAVPLAAPDPTRAQGLKLRLWRAQEAVVETFVASLGVTLVTAPLVLTAFQRVGAAGLLSNVVCLPLSAAMTMVAASGAAVFIVSPALATPLLWVGGGLSRLMLAIAHAFAGLTGAVVALPGPPVWLASLWWLGLALLVFAPGRWRWLALLAPLAAGLHVYGPGQRAGLDVTFLAVGHGDAIVLSSAGHHALVDGGGVPDGLDTGRRYVLPFLRHERIGHLDLVALSHPHPDHALGLASTLEVLPVDRLWLPAGAASGPLVEAVTDAALDAEIEQIEVGHTPYALGEAQVEVLGPPIDRLLLPHENDRSLVLRVRHGEVTILLPGDVEADGEEGLDPGPITVMKAPHHGSRTSSTSALLDAARPRHVVFCVGRANRFGFPHEEVVERYQARGARCWRTDLQGAVRFHSDGRDVTAESFLSPQG